ncbi:penicillin-binding transpeptidase domain-containing protein [Virgisporangium aurantiacum]|uniref:penicillin-binding transpeptidase domain-containing protein n=1 Tax=Virgisporangium aurantiacum TaxID=175570 RepID=UPI00194F4CC0|nr:penicillin-binding transpeptidase domain-containing protein [Virgisporangium aurantiacum]
MSLVYGKHVLGGPESRKTLPVGQPIKIYYSDGSTEMAQAGADNRTLVPFDKPTGHVLHNVMDELSKLRETDRNIARATAPGPGESRAQAIMSSGLKIITTIDKPTQDAAELYADVGKPDSPLYGVARNVQAALVAVEPNTGRVIAYYGGPTGAGIDYAGAPADPVLDDGKMKLAGYHPPAASFMIYTLGAGLSEGVSVNSYWNGTSPRQFPSRTGGNALRNATAEGVCPSSCPLWQVTVDSLNIPHFALTLRLRNQAASVLDFARAAGIRYMRDDNGQVHDLNSAKATELASTGTNSGNTAFSTEIGFGQYGVTVLDHANGVASLAAGGNAARVHFIREAWRGSRKVYDESVKLTPIPGYSPQMAADEAWTLQKVADRYGWNPPGRKVAAKTGTWELSRPDSRGANAHSWTVGYAAAARGDQDPARNWNGLAVAVWVGNKADELPIKLKDGKSMQGSSGAGQIFGAFMKASTEGKPVGVFPEPRFVGDEDAGDAGQQVRGN